MIHPIMTVRPVARFYYKGSHTHPVRRTVLMIEYTKHLIRGYELREGSTVRDFKDAPVKSYRRDRIALLSPYDSRKRKAKAGDTFRRSSLLDLIQKGV